MKKNPSVFVNRLLRAARLDSGVYEEVEADRGAMGQAVLAVLLSSLAAGVAGGDPGGILPATALALVSWIVWAFLAWLIGTRLLPEPQTRADPAELLRTLGFASSPGLIRLLGIIPALRPFIFFIAAVWMLAAMIVAIRQALDYRSTFRAAGVTIIGWLIQVFVTFILFTAVGSGATLLG